MALSRTELSNLFGQRADSPLMRRIFETIDTDNDGTVCAQEFVEFLVLVMKGNNDDKAQLIYDIYDVSNKTKLTIENVASIISLIKCRNWITKSCYGDPENPAGFFRFNRIMSVQFRFFPVQPGILRAFPVAKLLFSNRNELQQP